MTATDRLITGTDFMTVPTRNLEAAADFYGLTLGLKRSVFRPDRHFAEFETGNLTVGIIGAEAMGIEFHPNRNPLALHVDDVAAARALLQERGVTFHGDTLDTGVCHMAFFRDPDGNALMLHHRYAPRETEHDES